MPAEPSSDSPSREPIQADSAPSRMGLIVLLTVIAAAFVLSGWLRSQMAQTSTASVRSGVAPQRIVSLAPSVTETLFELGLGDRVVGVSRYCNYPPATSDLPRVGGLYDPNMEALCALRPDLIVTTETTGGTLQGVKKLGLSTLEVDHRGPEKILDSITVIGRACQAEQVAERLVKRLRTRLARVTKKTAPLPRPRVMLVVDHGSGGPGIENVFVAGSTPAFNPILNWAGGQNVFANTIEAFPVVSREAMLQANPEIIIDLVRVGGLSETDHESYRAAWQHLATIDAVKNNRIYPIADDYATVPGPRFILLVEHLARLLHPEVDWDTP